MAISLIIAIGICLAYLAAFIFVTWSPHKAKQLSALKDVRLAYVNARNEANLGPDAFSADKFYAYIRRLPFSVEDPVYAAFDAAYQMLLDARAAVDAYELPDIPTRRSLRLEQIQEVYHAIQTVHAFNKQAEITHQAGRKVQEKYDEVIAGFYRLQHEPVQSTSTNPIVRAWLLLLDANVAAAYHQFDAGRLGDCSDSLLIANAIAAPMRDLHSAEVASSQSEQETEVAKLRETLRHAAGSLTLLRSQLADGHEQNGAWQDLHEPIRGVVDYIAALHVKAKVLITLLDRANGLDGSVQFTAFVLHRASTIVRHTLHMMALAELQSISLHNLATHAKDLHGMIRDFAADEAITVPPGVIARFEELQSQSQFDSYATLLDYLSQLEELYNTILNDLANISVTDTIERRHATVYLTFHSMNLQAVAARLPSDETNLKEYSQLRQDIADAEGSELPLHEWEVLNLRCCNVMEQLKLLHAAALAEDSSVLEDVAVPRLSVDMRFAHLLAPESK